MKDFKSTLVPEYSGKRNPKEFYTNIYKNMFIAVMAINWYMLMKNLVSTQRL